MTLLNVEENIVAGLVIANILFSLATFDIAFDGNIMDDLTGSLIVLFMTASVTPMATMMYVKERRRRKERLEEVRKGLTADSIDVLRNSGVHVDMITLNPMPQ